MVAVAMKADAVAHLTLLWVGMRRTGSGMGVPPSYSDNSGHGGSGSQDGLPGYGNYNDGYDKPSDPPGSSRWWGKSAAVLRRPHQIWLSFSTLYAVRGSSLQISTIRLDYISLSALDLGRQLCHFIVELF